MEPLNQKTQEEVTEIIKYLLEPISGEVESFGEPREISSTIMELGKPKRFGSEIVYPILVATKFGKLDFSLSSNYISNPKEMAMVACYALLTYEDAIPRESKREILSKLYSQEILEFGKE